MTKLNKLLFLISAIIIFIFLFLYIKNSTTKIIEPEKELPMFTLKDLKTYDGTDLSKPVYIGYEGYVYDVSSGRADFYNPGKDYHYLAGKDSTIELNIAGGSIIKRKYKIVGIYK